MTHIFKKRGFSLIETCIYIALLSFFILSTTVVVWQVVESVRRVYVQLRAEQEGLFVVQKIEQLLHSGKVITPKSGTSTLLVVHAKDSGVGEVTIRRNSVIGAVEMRRGDGGTFVPLTTNGVVVSTLLLEAIPADAEKPAQLYVLFDVGGELFEMHYVVRE